MKNIFKKVIIIAVLLLGISIVVYTYSSRAENFVKSIFGEKLLLDESVYGETSFNSENLSLVPILDSELNEKKDNVVKISFNVGGSLENTKEDIVYDIALVDLEVDCELLSPYIKWRLVKNNTLIYEGSLDYKFDTIKNGRLVLIPIQQDLKPYSEDKNTYDHYDFYMWISDNCQDTLENCIANGSVETQEELMGKKLKGKIEVELYGGTKRILERTPSDTLNTETCIGKDSDAGA